MVDYTLDFLFFRNFTFIHQVIFCAVYPSATINQANVENFTENKIYPDTSALDLKFYGAARDSLHYYMPL